jgi:Pyridoxamine 5'-phosphate oxidase
MTEALAVLQEQSFARANAATVTSFPPERRLSGSQLTGYLDRRAFAVIGSRRPDGRPHAAMSSYVRRGAVFWLPTVAGSARERNVRREPWVTLTVAEGDNDAHVVVLIEGAAAVVPLAGAPADVRAEVSGDWIAAWIRLEARLLSYASEGALR